MKKFFLLAILLTFSSTVFSAELLTNSAHFANAPSWLTLNRVNKVAAPIENFMEWSTHRVEVIWYQDQAAFEKAHSVGPAALAVSLRGQDKILLGPRVTEKNFDPVFGHELVHVISSQKYKDAIPSWLEEGIANFVSKNGSVDYRALGKTTIKDVNELAHPMYGEAAMIHSRYQASQALAEMIASHCDLRGLLRLSVQRKLQDYLENICRISNINSSFQKWIKEKSGQG
jgi:hypothetical protein